MRFPRFCHRYFTTWAWGSYIATAIGILPAGVFPAFGLSIVVFAGSCLINVMLNEHYHLASDLALHYVPVPLCAFINTSILPNGVTSLIWIAPLPLAYLAFHKANMRKIIEYYRFPGKYLYFHS